MEERIKLSPKVFNKLQQIGREGLEAKELQQATSNGQASPLPQVTVRQRTKKPKPNTHKKKRKKRAKGQKTQGSSKDDLLLQKCIAQSQKERFSHRQAQPTELTFTQEENDKVVKTLNSILEARLCAPDCKKCTDLSRKRTLIVHNEHEQHNINITIARKSILFKLNEASCKAIKDGRNWTLKIIKGPYDQILSIIKESNELDKPIEHSYSEDSESDSYLKDDDRDYYSANSYSQEDSSYEDDEYSSSPTEKYPKFDIPLRDKMIIEMKCALTRHTQDDPALHVTYKSNPKSDLLFDLHWQSDRKKVMLLESSDGEIKGQYNTVTHEYNPITESTKETDTVGEHWHLFGTTLDDLQSLSNLLDKKSKDPHALYKEMGQMLVTSGKQTIKYSPLKSNTEVAFTVSWLDKENGAFEIKSANRSEKGGIYNIKKDI